MKKQFSAEIEEKRVRIGQMATGTGELSGCFVIRCQPTGEKLKIIVSNGEDWTECGFEGEPWEHVSVSCMTRVPTWAEMCWVKDQFFEDDEVVVQFHPAKVNYINDHPFVLHLWRPTVTPVPMPPLGCV